MRRVSPPPLLGGKIVDEEEFIKAVEAAAEQRFKLMVCDVLQEWLEETTAASPHGSLSVPEALNAGLQRLRNKVRAGA